MQQKPFTNYCKNFAISLVYLPSLLLRSLVLNDRNISRTAVVRQSRSHIDRRFHRLLSSSGSDFQCRRTDASMQNAATGHSHPLAAHSIKLCTPLAITDVVLLLSTRGNTAYEIFFFGHVLFVSTETSRVHAH